MGFTAISSCRAATIAFSSPALFAQADIPSPASCTAQDASFISAFHALTVVAALLAALLSFYVVPRTLRFRMWWLTRSRFRFGVVFAGLFFLAASGLLLPWLEAVYGLGLGFSTLGLFQVSYAYIECRQVEFAHQSYLWGDFFRASTVPSVFLVSAQVFTFTIVFAIAAALVTILHHVLVRRSISKASARLGERP